MHYNQPYCGSPPNGLNNGFAYGYNTCNPPPINRYFYPHSIVGEGDVNCVTLPDGTCQFYFTPTTNWCCSNTPFNINNSNNANPSWNPNLGTWFVRSITSPVPGVWNNTICQRNEAPVCHPVDCSRNVIPIDTGYQVKFHNDVRTSTSDIHYFYPCLRHVDYTLALPTRGCAAVQVDTPLATNTICHYEVVCPQTQPCNVPCTRVNTSVSAMSLDADTKQPENVTCHCVSPLQFKRCSKNKSLQRLQLLPTDGRKKRIKLERRKPKPVESKSRDVMCECKPPPSVNKSVHNACSSGRNINKSVQFSRCWGKEMSTQGDSYIPPCAKEEAEIWAPITDSITSMFQNECCKVIKIKSRDEMCQSCSKPSETKENVAKSKSKDVCECCSSISSEKLTQNIILSQSKDELCQCTSSLTKRKEKQEQGKKRKSKDVVTCECEPTPSSDNVKGTEDACKSSCCDLQKKLQPPRCCGKKVPVVKGDAFFKSDTEMWCPVTESIRKIFERVRCGSASPCCTGYCDT